MEHSTVKQINKDTLDKTSLSQVVKQFSKAKILVIGDLILDEYLIGYPERISREAPVLILKYLESKFSLGGAGNAAANIAALGAEVSLIGITGDDVSAQKIQQLCQNSSIKLHATIDLNKSTTCKTRIISTSNSNPDNGPQLKQQVLRFDIEDSSEHQANTYQELLESYKNTINQADIILYSDYSNGVFNSRFTQDLISNSPNKKIIVDSNGSLDMFCGVYSFTPNQPDLEKLLNTKIGSEEEMLKASNNCLARLKCNELLITRGAKGMLLNNKTEASFIPAFNLSEVFDVTGAGDTVSAAYSTALACNSSTLDAAVLGNLAASIVVKKPGTATCNQDELFELIEHI